MVNFYCQFLPNCAGPVLPLTNRLSAPKVSLDLTGEALTAFERTDNSLAEVTLHTHSAPEAQLYLLVDASTVALYSVKWEELYVNVPTNTITSQTKQKSSAGSVENTSAVRGRLAPPLTPRPSPLKTPYAPRDPSRWAKLVLAGLFDGSNCSKDNHRSYNAPALMVVEILTLILGSCSPNVQTFDTANENPAKRHARDSGFYDACEGRSALIPPELPPRMCTVKPTTPKRPLPNLVKVDSAVEGENMYEMLEGTAMYKDRGSNISTGYSLRCFLIDELIDNETKFKKEISQITSLLSSGDVEVPITSEDLRLIFINLGEYLSVSKKIIAAFKSAKEGPSYPESACVAGAFLPLIPSFKDVYVGYIKLFDPQLLQKRPHLEHYFAVASEMLTQRDGNTSNLSDRLLAPFQRPFKISNVFERMKKCTPVGHPDHENLMRVLVQLQDLIATADQVKRPGSEYASNITTELAPAVAETKLDIAVITSTENWNNSRLTNCRWRWEKINCFLENLCKQIPTFTESLIAYINSKRKMLKGVEQFTQVVKSKNTPMCMASAYLAAASFDQKFNADALKQTSEALVERLSKLSKIVKKKPVEPIKRLDAAYKFYQDIKKDKNFPKSIRPADEKVIMDYARSKELLAVGFSTLLNNATEIINDCLITYGLAVQTALQSTTLRLTNYQAGFELPMNSASLVEQIKREAAECIAKVRQSSHYVQAPPPMPQSPRRCRVKFLYDESRIKDITVGDFVRVLRDSDDRGNKEWCLIKTTRGEEGYYPASYLDL
ncbi:hypothetical protein SprV_0401450000 [Sparganum proliferum]